MIYKYDKDTKQLKRQNIISRNNYLTLQESIKKNMQARISSDNIYFGKDTVFYFPDKTENKTNLSKFTEQLILVIPEKSCNVCYDEIYEALKYATDSLKLTINLFTSKHRYRETKNMMAEFKILGDLYYFPSDFLTTQISIEFAPYFIYIDQQKQGKNIFIPFTQFPSLTYYYLQAIHKRYFLNPD